MNAIAINLYNFLTGLVTPEQVVHFVLQHLIKQGQPAIADNAVQCQYLTPTGLQCGVGCLIPRADYKAIIENNGVRDIIDRLYPETLPRNTWGEDMSDRIELLCCIQGLHDDATTVEFTSFTRDWLHNRVAEKLRDCARHSNWRAVAQMAFIGKCIDTIPYDTQPNTQETLS